MTAPLLDVQNLSVAFRRRAGVLGTRQHVVQAVDDVSFDIAPGEIVGLVGESGSGKSTIGRMVLGLLAQDSGEIRFEGQPIPRGARRHTHDYHRAVQAVFQDPLSSLNPALRISGVIEEPLKWLLRMPQAERDAEVCRLLEAVGLDPALRERFPHELSGGQRQRVAIARALAPKPKLIVCDEAVSALDVSTQAKIINLLEDLRDSEGIALLFIAHDLEVVRHMCQRVGVLYHGQLMEWGPADEVHDRPRHPYTRALLASVPTLDPAERSTQRAKRRAAAGNGAPAAAGQGCAFAGRCPHVMDACHERPPMISGSESVSVACHFHEAGASGTTPSDEVILR